MWKGKTVQSGLLSCLASGRMLFTVMCIKQLVYETVCWLFPELINPEVSGSLQPRSAAALNTLFALCSLSVRSLLAFCSLSARSLLALCSLSVRCLLALYSGSSSSERWSLWATERGSPDPAGDLAGDPSGDPAGDPAGDRRRLAW